MMMLTCIDSPVAKGVWYDKFGGNLPPIWMNTIMYKVQKKLVAKKNFTC